MKFKIFTLLLSPLIAALVGVTPVLGKSSDPMVKKSSPPTPTIAMQPELAAAPPAAPTPDLRWLGYGLFLLQIGWIPLQFVKVQAIRLDE